MGDRAPGFRLPDARGGEVALDDLLIDGSVVLVFYRGAWCSGWAVVTLYVAT
jgi:peroxiredoxin